MVDHPSVAFRRALARSRLQSLAGPRSFERGHDYALDGRVSALTTTDDAVRAIVSGSHPYQVAVHVGDDDVEWECDCPVGQRGQLCKHVVAVTLVSTGQATPEPSRDTPSPPAQGDLKTYLTTLDQQALIDLVLERAALDGLFEARLLAAASIGTGVALQEAPYRQALAAAFDTDGYVDYREAWDYTSGIVAVLDEVHGLLDAGYAAEVKNLSEYAADLGEESIGYIDDSDGGMSVVAEEIRDLHLHACRLARPDAKELAGTLFDRERADDTLEIFYGAVETYAEVLGEEGLAEYRRLASAEWDALPALGPGDRHGEWSSARFRITGIMLSLADLAGDVDEAVRVLAHDQSSAYGFLTIAQRLSRAQRHDEALEWALRGLSAHGRHDRRLIEFIAAEHHRAGRAEQAIEICWDAYQEAPSVETYRRLKDYAQRADLWSEHRDRARTLLRDHAKAQPDRSILVAVLLLDGDAEQAWAEASAGGCRRDQWLDLARLREDEHPDDAIPLWREEVSRLIAAKNNQSYAEAVDLIDRIGQLMSAAGRADDFAPYVAGLAAVHKRRRNLMTLFSARGW